MLPGLCLATPMLMADTSDLAPQMVRFDALVLEENFNQSRSPDIEHWKPRQHTRWTIEEGVLRGQPSTREFQASQDHHQGLEPRLSIPSCPNEFAIRFSIRFIGGEATSLCPFIEFGHHVARIYWNDEGAQLLANKESVQLDQDPRFILEKGKWYQGLAEVRGEEILVRFAHGPLLYGQHASLNVKRDGFGVAGFRGGKVELDNIQVWSLKDATTDGWNGDSLRLKPAVHKILKPEMIPGS